MIGGEGGRVGLCALRAHPSLRSGPPTLPGDVLRRASRASSNPSAFVHSRLATKARRPPAVFLRSFGKTAGGLLALAERVGFEPSNTLWVLLEFQSSAFDRSATSPFEGRTAYQNAQCRMSWIASNVGVPSAFG